MEDSSDINQNLSSAKVTLTSEMHTKDKEKAALFGLPLLSNK